MKLNGVPKIFWVEAVNMTCYIMNMSPHAALEGRGLEKIWTGNLIEYFDLKVFGYPYFMHIHDIQGSMLDSKSRECMFLGMKKCGKGYKL